MGVGLAFGILYPDSGCQTRCWRSTDVDRLSGLRVRLLPLRPVQMGQLWLLRGRMALLRSGVLLLGPWDGIVSWYVIMCGVVQVPDFVSNLGLGFGA